MPDFLLEIGCEEIPARMLDKAQEQLQDKVAGILHFSGLKKVMGFGHPQSFSTPRRLAVLVQDVLAQQPDVEEQLTGPSVTVAYKNGIPTPAAHAFAKKVGVDVAQLQRIKTPKGEYLCAKIIKKGKTAQEILSEALPKNIADIYWPKSMYWRKGKAERFIRPIRWIVALLDGEVVPFEFGGIRAGAQSRGHRILGPEKVSISTPTQYIEQMRDAHVEISVLERQARIIKELDQKTSSIPGMRVRKDDKYAELLNTVVHLTEWPSVILGNFDLQFLSLPEEVLVTVMRDHQKYFAVEDANGKLAPHFLAVLNTDGDRDGLIRHGNERVLRARFNDAQFFWNTDQKIPLLTRVEMLRHVTFQKDLGNYYDKTQRVIRIATNLAAVLRKAGQQAEHDIVYDAALRAKADLTTEMVKEFTELQGMIGGLYVRAQGIHGREKDGQFVGSVADAIYDHYKPESMEDSVPRTVEGAVVSIADKADSIAGMFSLGLVPSGSKDPFALRRQANAIVKTVAERNVRMNLSQLMAEARNWYDGSEAEKKFSDTDPVYHQTVKLFFWERLEFYLRDVLGLAYDVVNATLAAGADDVVDAVARAQAVAKVRPSSDFESISIGFKRMKNILRQAEETKKRVADPFTVKVFKQDEERSLAEVSRLLSKKVKELGATKQYDEALLEISKLRRPIDSFFDKVMVMVEDEALRANRLGLLQTLVREFSSIADFSEIVTEGK